MPCLPSSERALRAIARLTLAAARPPETAEHAVPAVADLAGGVLPEYLAKRVLGGYDLPFPAGGLADTIEQAVVIADRLGYPVALKAQSAQLSHKSDAGAVVLRVVDADAVRAGWQRLHDNVAAYDPGLHLDGVLVEKMGTPGIELIVGARNEPGWGPVILVGFGGVTAELHKDVRLLAPDLPADQIVTELYRLKSAALLSGFRGSPPLDVPAVAELVARLGAIMLANPRIAEIDLNPVVVQPAGAGVLALDALMLTTASAPSAG